jgi:hypothetical protein
MTARLGAGVMQGPIRAALAAGVHFTVRPDRLGDDDVEPGVHTCVRLINESGWALTRYSCEGHPPDPDLEAPAMWPYVQVACSRDDWLELTCLMDEIALEAKSAGELAFLHGTVLTPSWRAMGLCFGRPRGYHGDPRVLIESARTRLVTLANRICTARERIDEEGTSHRPRPCWFDRAHSRFRAS